MAGSNINQEKQLRASTNWRLKHQRRENIHRVIYLKVAGSVGRGHFKDECSHMRCRFYKMLGHVIVECPTLPENLNEGSKEVRKRPPIKSWEEKRETRGKAAYTGANRTAAAQHRPEEKRQEQQTQEDMTAMPSRANPRNRGTAEHSCVNPRIGGTAKHNCATPRVFIPISDQATQEFQQLSNVIGEIQLGHGNPTKEEIVAGLSLSISAKP